MAHEPADKPFPASLAEMVAAPLIGRLIGASDSSFVIAEWTDRGAPPGKRQPIAPVHIHHADDEAWYVLEGVLGFRLGDQEVEAAAGTAVFAPRSVPHSYWNARSTPARYLLIMTPAIRLLIEALHALPTRDAASMQAVFRHYDSELL